MQWDSQALRLLRKLRQLATAEWLPLPDETEFFNSPQGDYVALQFHIYDIPSSVATTKERKASPSACNRLGSLSNATARHAAREEVLKWRSGCFLA